VDQPSDLVANRRSALSDCTRWARLYAEHDRLLSSNTRFFAAAASTNRTLGDVAVLRSALGVSHDSLVLLWELGGVLEAFNRQAASEIAAGSIDDGDLDRRMVHFEQYQLECAIRSAGVDSELAGQPEI
jgi:hypothetical protein